jgi:hypothetical protein
MSNRYTGAASGALRPQGSEANYATPSTQMGNFFTNPALFSTITDAAGTFFVYNASDGADASTTTSFFSEMARRGLEEQTNWSEDTFKTILSTTGPLVMFCYISCTAGGSETHTVEITASGITKTFAIPLTSGQRGVITGSTFDDSTFWTTAARWVKPTGQVLSSNKTIFENQPANGIIPGHMGVQIANLPCLAVEDDSAFLIRAKHSSAIVNSTATAFSGIMYRKGLAA